MSRMINRCVLSLAISVLATALPAAGQVLDQSQELIPYSFNGDASWARWQQGITVGVAGQLVGIEISVNEEGGRPPGNGEIYINRGAPWQGDAHDFETLFNAQQPGWNYIDLTSANLVFEAGEQFVIGVQGIGGDLWFRGSGPTPPEGPYPGGALWFEESVFQRTEYDMAFRTWMVESSCDPCDMNCDGDVNAFDIEPFLDLLFGGGTPCDVCTGDVDGNGVIDAFDIEPFLECLFP